MDFNSKKDEHVNLEQLINAMDLIRRRQETLLIGIDGCGGSGKSTLANQLKKSCFAVTLVQMDDFYLPSSQRLDVPAKEKPIGADFDWGRLLKEVLEPLNRNEEGFYQRYDWEKDELADWHTVPVGAIVVIEGVYSLRNELVDKYDFTVWVDCPRDKRLERGVERDGEDARDTWENNWMIQEDLYVEEHQPLCRADLVVNGTTYTHNP